MIVGVSLLFSTLFFIISNVTTPLSVIASLVSMSLAVTFSCIKFAIVIDMVLYVVKPRVHSEAYGIKLMAEYALGDALSPFLVGEIASILCTSYSYKPKEARDFRSLQNALWHPIVAGLISGLIYVGISFIIEEDINNAEEKSTALQDNIITEKNLRTIPKFPRVEVPHSSIDVESGYNLENDVHTATNLNDKYKLVNADQSEKEINKDDQKISLFKTSYKAPKRKVKSIIKRKRKLKKRK